MRPVADGCRVLVDPEEGAVLRHGSEHHGVRTGAPSLHRIPVGAEEAPEPSQSGHPQLLGRPALGSSSRVEGHDAEIGDAGARPRQGAATPHRSAHRRPEGRLPQRPGKVGGVAAREEDQRGPRNLGHHLGPEGVLTDLQLHDRRLQAQLPVMREPHRPPTPEDLVALGSRRRGDDQHPAPALTARSQPAVHRLRPGEELPGSQEGVPSRHRRAQATGRTRGAAQGAGCPLRGAAQGAG